ncbi:TraB/GumN family protein [Spirosoma rhododendri]|uniref:TraB/GumN family protein n=1 Tax=Spirosoma rhododendri TaxID=2728024 RepID=A0A7L5DPF1_9BACT|nr:TraB/GumN family protein [Spirosoma rhododendri]QJD77897.1 TraB/GumN family protein [Spirosoma rhododendri]
MRILLLILVLLGGRVSGQSMLWEVSGNDLKQPSYLFGTYHILKDSYLKQAPAVQQAFDKSAGVVVETTVDSAAMLSMAMKAMMPGKNLKQLISAPDYDLVAKEFKTTTGYDLAMFSMMKPIMTATTLSMAYTEKESDTLSHFTGQPIDLFFATEGHRKDKLVTPLETMEQQMNFLFDHDPVEKQAADLVTMVKEKADMRKAAGDLTKLYLKGDLNGLYKLSRSYEDKYGDLSFLVTERNQTWMKRLPGLMASRPTFIAVGALHLAGPDGLVSLLQKQGYKLRAVK